MDDRRIRQATAWVSLATAIAGYLYIDSVMSGPVSRFAAPPLLRVSCLMREWRGKRQAERLAESEARRVVILAEIIKEGPA